jgi:2-polyprenyl-6-methoxyphenol hydroxylase-like FAD-dependent oxidoreductase
MAMLDALELSESLTDPSFKDIKSSISHYEKRMFKRFSKVGRMTMLNTKRMHQPGALQNMLSMFSKNIFKQWLFQGKMWLNSQVMSFPD